MEQVRWLVGVAFVVLIIGVSAAVGLVADRDDIDGFDWELASIVLTGLGTTALALVTWQSVSASSRQLAVEAKRLEASQWPRLFPVALNDWIASSGDYDNERWRRVLPVRNGGPGVALNVTGHLEWKKSPGDAVNTVTTSIGPGDLQDLRPNWIGQQRPLESEKWDQVAGRLDYDDINGGRWRTSFRIETEGNRAIRVQATELLLRPDGTPVVGRDTTSPAAWYTPTTRARWPAWLRRQRD